MYEIVCVNESEHCVRFVYGDDVEWYILFDCDITYSLVSQPHSSNVFFIYHVLSFIFGFILQLHLHFLILSCWLDVASKLRRLSRLNKKHRSTDDSMNGNVYKTRTTEILTIACTEQEKCLPMNVCVCVLIVRRKKRKKKKIEPDDERWIISDVVQENWRF